MAPRPKPARGYATPRGFTIGSGIRLSLSPLSFAGAVEQLAEAGRMTLPNVTYTVDAAPTARRAWTRRAPERERVAPRPVPED